MTLIPFRDSSIDRPTAAQARAARAAGVGAWFGYLATRPDVGLEAPWSRADFDAVREGGLINGAFASGWDDPVALRELAHEWGVTWLFLDVEPGIRGDGPWVDSWLRASGAGLYGLCGVHYHSAPTHIMARYPGVPISAASWDTDCPTPSGLLGWQAQGTHQDPVTGLSVDGGWLDGGFAPTPAPHRRQGGLPMSTSFGPTTSDSFAAGYFQGKPIGNFADRTVFVAVAADEALPDAAFPVKVRVWFVPHDYTDRGPSPEYHDVVVGPSQQVTVSPLTISGELSVRLEHQEGGPYVARVYAEENALA